MLNNRIKTIVLASIFAFNFTDLSFAIDKISMENTIDKSDIVISDDSYITRLGFVKLINEALQYENIEDINFKDINKNDANYEEVAKAIRAGYIKGYEDNTFRPNNYITREEICAIISEILGDKDFEFDKIETVKDFSDISDWSKPYVEMNYENGYIKGYEDNSFRPKNNTTIKEARIIVDRLKNSFSKQETTVLIESDNYELQKYEPRQGTYLGAYILQDELINASMEKFEELTGKKHASYFKYLGYKEGNLEEFKKWMYEVKENNSSPHIALEPNKGLDEVLEDEYLIELAKMFGEYEEPVFLRYASEMNGDWVAWNGDCDLYIEKWKMVHNVMEKYAPNVIMVWTPFTTPENSIIEYYPGDEYVDWVGVNVYNVVYHNDDINQGAMHEDPLELLDFVYDNFSHKKPIQISEYGATHYTTTDGKYYVDFAVEKINRMYEGILNEYPRIKSIFYFDVNNLVNAPEGRKINNYAITDEPKITNTYKNIVSDDIFLDSMSSNEEGIKDKELFTLRDKAIKVGNSNYINIEDVSLILGGDLVIDNNSIIYNLNGQTLKFDYLKKGEDVYFVKLNDVAKKLGLNINVDKQSIYLSN